MRSLLLAALGLVLGLEGTAEAYCRATSCACKKNEDQPIIGPDGFQVLNDKGVPQTTCGQPTGTCPRDENGCSIKGTPNAWFGGCVGYSPNLAGTSQLSPDQYNAAFEKAFQAWALVDCGGGRHPSIQAFALRPTTCAASEHNEDGPNVNTLYFTDDGWSDYTPSDAAAVVEQQIDAVIARTKTHFESNGQIVDADIAINSARHDFTVDDNAVEFDLVSVLTHEAGHFYGLDHSSDPNAIMYWEYNPGTVKRDLQADDIAAICAVYPPDRQATCDPTPIGGLEDTCGPKPKLAGCSATVSSPASDGAPIAFSILGVSMLFAKWRKRR